MQIYYFTRTGRSKAVAEKLAETYGTEARPIKDGKNWNGPLGYIRAGAAALSKKESPAAYEPLKEGEEAAVVFPVWAGKLPPAVRFFVRRAGRQRLIAVPTSLGSELKDREGFQKVIDLVGKDLTPPEKLL